MPAPLTADAVLALFASRVLLPVLTRRFNWACYDADRMVAAFAAQPLLILGNRCDITAPIAQDQGISLARAGAGATAGVRITRGRGGSGVPRCAPG